MGAPVTTSDRLLSVLGLFTLEHPEWTVESAAKELDLAVSTAYRYFRSLAKAGLIVAFATGRYVLGPAIIQYDRQMRLADPLTTTAQATMKRLARKLPPKTLVMLCRLFRNQVMCVHQEAEESPHFAVSYERGRPMPLFRGAASKIILAHMAPRTVKSLYAEHATEFAQAGLGRRWEDVKPRLRDLRSAGVAITQGEIDPGLTGIAVGLFEAGGTVVGSLSVVMTVRERSPRVVAATTEALRAGSEEIGWALSLLATGHDSPAPVTGRTPALKQSRATPARARPSSKGRRTSRAR
jgi:DNA-binding IclR family transcriptional regulator